MLQAEDLKFESRSLQKVVDVRAATPLSHQILSSDGKPICKMESRCQIDMSALDYQSEMLADLFSLVSSDNGLKTFFCPSSK